jgi:hypothetical protein
MRSELHPLKSPKVSIRELSSEPLLNLTFIVPDVPIIFVDVSLIVVSDLVLNLT